MLRGRLAAEPASPGSPRVKTTYDYDLVCIGSGPAGQRAAVQAAKLGKRVAVVERGRSLGGVCIETGTIPSKTFREAVLFVHSARPATASGCRTLRPDARPTAEQLLARVAEVVAPRGGGHRGPAPPERRHRHPGRGLVHRSPHGGGPGDAGKRTAHRPTNIVIAVGTRAGDAARRRPPTARSSSPATTSCGSSELPRAMAVVGAGVIGIEYASMFAALGGRRSR